MRSWSESALARALQWAVGLAGPRVSSLVASPRVALSRRPCAPETGRLGAEHSGSLHASERAPSHRLVVRVAASSQPAGRPAAWMAPRPPARRHARASFEFLFHPSIHPHGSVCRSHRPAKVVLHIPVARAPRRLPPRAPQEPKTVRPDLPKTLRRRFAKGTDPPRAPHPPVVASVVQEGAFPGSVQVQSTLEQDLFLQR